MKKIYNFNLSFYLLSLAVITGLAYFIIQIGQVARIEEKKNFPQRMFYYPLKHQQGAVATSSEEYIDQSMNKDIKE